MAAGSRDTVSVVIPTYNRPEHLDGAIRTALGQTYDPIEVTVVDDGSDDDYAREVVGDHPPSVTCIEHDENRGLSAARNTGIEASDGRYIAFLDDDDRWHRRKLAEQVAALGANEEAGLATCLTISITPAGDLVHCQRGVAEGDLSDSILQRNVIGSPSKVLIRRRCLDDVDPFDESLPTKQDWDFYLRLCQHWRVVAVDAHRYLRLSHDSMSTDPGATERDYRAIVSKHERLIRERGQWRASQAAIEEVTGRAHLEAGSPATARRHLWRAFRMGPTGRRVGLLALSLTHDRIAEAGIALKRTFATRYNGCHTVQVTPETFPGLAVG